MAVGAALVAVVALVALARARDEARKRQTACGTKVVFGRSLKLWVVGTGISCEEAAKIVAEPCEEEKTWSCYSLHPPDPFLVWSSAHTGTEIEARRYPCSEATVTAAMWAVRQPDDREPTRHQMLADDLVRCGQLKGKTYRQVRALLGRPTEGSKRPGGRHAGWLLGVERGSLFKVDSEYLSMSFDAADRLQLARLAQG